MNVRELLDATRKHHDVRSIQYKYEIIELNFGCIYGYNEFEEVDINHRNERGGAVLTSASYGGDEKAVKILLEAGANVNVQDIDGETALMLASGGGYEEIVKMLLAPPESSSSIDVNVQSSWGHTALMSAVYWNRVAIVRILIAFAPLESSMFIDINLQSKYGYDTALQLARRKGHKEIVEMLEEASYKMKLF